jgi:hypothetical protein
MPPLRKSPTEEEQNILKVTINFRGRTLSAIGKLPDVAHVSEGPMSLEGACMGLVKGLCQALFRKAKAKLWKSKEEDDENGHDI